MYEIFDHRLNTNILYPIRQCKNVLINVTKMFVLQKASSKKIYEYELRTPNGGRLDRTLCNTRVIIVEGVVVISKIFLNGRTLTRLHRAGHSGAESPHPGQTIRQRSCGHLNDVNERREAGHRRPAACDIPNRLLL